MFEKTYTEQALADAPFGCEQRGGSVICLYARGCAIGRFLPPDVATDLKGSVSSILLGEQQAGPHDERVREILTGQPAPLTGPSGKLLAFAYLQLQQAHDTSARAEDKPGYRARLQAFAQSWNLQIPGTAEGIANATRAA